MAINNFSLSDLTERIMLVLPARFSRETSAYTYKFFEALCDGFILNSSSADELFKQTSLAGASGEYVDAYISELSGLGRYKEGNVYLDDDENDEQLITRYKNTIYTYNSTKNGLRQVVIDFIGNPPMYMYTANKRGAYAGGRYYYNDGHGSTYGREGNIPFTGYIEFSREPNEWLKEELKTTLNKCRGYGITVYLKWPSTDDLDVEFEDGELERAELV